MGSIPITRSKPPAPLAAPGIRSAPASYPLHRLYQARDRIEAQFIVDLLGAHRIPAAILGDYLSGAAGGLPLDISPTVCLLDEADLARARKLLDGFLSDATGGSPWRCPSCGESVEAGFDLCWRCGRPRPA